MITLENGHIQNASSIFVPYGSISFSLNVDATVIAAPGGFVCADIPIVFQLDGSGNLIQPAKLWSNEELQPQLSSTLLGTYYLVTIRDQNGAVLNSQPLWWQFPEVVNSVVDISQMTPVSTVGGVVIFYPTSFASSGTVTSVAFVGDGTILSATPSTPVTTSGNITATLLTQNANLVFAGPPTPGPAALPTFRSLATGDVPPLLWNSLIAATGNLILANTTFTTTFNQTTPAAWIWANVTPATAILAQSSPVITIRGQSWNGSVSVNNDFTIQNIPANGTNAGQTLTITSILANGGVSVGNLSASALLLAGTLNVSSTTSLNSPGATGITNPNSPAFILNSAWWDGAASHGSATTFQDIEGSGVNPTATTTISNSGAFAWAGVNIQGQLMQTAAHGETYIYGSSTELITLSTGGTTTDSSGNLLPAGAIIDSVVARVTTTISGGSTPTTWEIGDATTASRFTSTGTTLTAGSTVVGLNQMKGGVSTDAAGPTQASAAKIRITLDQTPGQGAVRVTVFWRQFTAPTS